MEGREIGWGEGGVLGECMGPVWNKGGRGLRVGLGATYGDGGRRGGIQGRNVGVIQPLGEMGVIEIEHGLHIVEAAKGVMEGAAGGRVGDVKVGDATGRRGIVRENGGDGLVICEVVGGIPGGGEEGVVVEVERAKDHRVGVGEEVVRGGVDEGDEVLVCPVWAGRVGRERHCGRKRSREICFNSCRSRDGERIGRGVSGNRGEGSASNPVPGCQTGQHVPG